MTGLRYLGVDSDGVPYWDGKPLELRQRFSLTPIQNLAVVLLVTSAVTLALLNALRFFGFGH